MFTGLIEGTGKVIRVISNRLDVRVIIMPPWPLDEVILGESIAVNGVCLTVVDLNSQGFCVDISSETLSCTTLKDLQFGSVINLERAIKLGERLAGHLVTGHVDCVGTLTRIEHVSSSVRLYITIPPNYLRLVVEKGSIAVNGISLTVNQVSTTGLFLNIVPYTLGQTTLKLVAQGDSVNIETDLIGKYIVRLFRHNSRQPLASLALNRESLTRMGFD